MEQQPPPTDDDAVDEPAPLPGATPGEQPAATDVQVDPRDDRY